MPKTAVAYVCAECGASHSKWAGRCSECGAWNSLEETAVAKGPAKGFAPATVTALETQPITRLGSGQVSRFATGSAEFDRVLGGGIVPGSIMLLGGEPGIGKSTLLLQISGNVAAGGKVLYVSGEESADQIGLRASRLGVAEESLLLVGATDVEAIAATVVAERPRLAIIDSIQTMSTDRFSSGPGSITQVRECAARLQAVAKAHQVPLMLVGHVTKEGQVAGPKVLEHLVDTVLYLEGEKFHGFRLLRGAKNRFGPTEEVGVFRMEENGLQDVANPAAAFVDGATAGAPGTAVTASMEGTRVLLIEVQALTVETAFGYPKRTSAGFDPNKLSLLIAVLQKRAGLKLASSDVYLNVSGGYRLQEPANDLAVALAVAGAVRNQALPADTVAIGEVGLSGEVRPVTGLQRRLEEAVRGGVKQAVVPRQTGKAPRGLKLIPVTTVAEAVQSLGKEQTPK